MGIRRIAYVIVGLVLALVVLLIIVDLRQAFWITMVQQHFAATVGLPACAGAAFVLVTLLRNTSGPIEFEGLGFKFRGASGPIVMWLITFLGMVGALKIMW